ncbi:hypothetical protein [Enterovirga rhinocerotis]|uniref:Uncharacterized protein n=1 Tax=Enterovirga rhinocerotis TaxID=1339210 RepID=A0A4R7BXL0_9HYPH|nr:hypothetical protein [Enterovirga rhinocerotis]TDR88937.1 hypothetical protein EV668_3422 [Enterovirga rhinocerotis]
MVVLLCMLSLAMMATGLYATYLGSTIIQVERGWTMVIAGSVVATGGTLLLGAALLAQRLGRIRYEIVGLRDRLASIGEMTAEQLALEQMAAEDDEEPEPEPVRKSKPEPSADLGLRPAFQPAAEPPAPKPPAAPRPPEAERVVVGQYESGGNAYTMFSDGSIDASTPAGLRRFASLEELRSFVSSGGERGS